MNFVILTYAKDSLKVYSMDRLVSAAAARGHTIQRVRYDECLAWIEGGVPRLSYRGRDLNDIDAVIPWVMQSEFEYGVEILRQFEVMGAFLLNTPEAFWAAANKWQTAQLFALHGVPQPDVHRLRHAKDVEELFDKLGQQIVLKTLTGGLGKGVFLVDRHSVGEDTFELERECIVQEFVRESAGSDIRVFVVGGVVVTSMLRSSGGNDFRSNLSIGGSGSTVDLTNEERETAIIAARAVGLRLAGVDMLRSSRGPLILEVNASPGFGIEKVTGRDVASAVIEYVEMNAKRRNRKDKVGA